MRNLLFLLPVILLSCAGSSKAQKGSSIKLNNLADSAGYALGVDVGNSLKQRNMTAINRDMIREAMESHLQGKPSLIDENECFLILNTYSNLCMSGDSSAVNNKSGQPQKPGKNDPAKPAGVVLRDLADSAGYALGINLSNSLKAQDMTELNRSLVHLAMGKVFAGDSLLISPDQSYGILSYYAGRVAREKAAAVIKAGEDFLAENAKRPEVKTTASGLQYEVLHEGTGIRPTASDIFVCHYRGSLLDGTEFDASYNRNQPLEMGVSQVIRGWTEGLQLMPAGSKYKFYIPYQLGYGVNGSPPAIPGGAALIFEVELLEVKKRE